MNYEIFNATRADTSPPAFAASVPALDGEVIKTFPAAISLTFSEPIELDPSQGSVVCVWFVCGLCVVCVLCVLCVLCVFACL